MADNDLRLRALAELELEQESLASPPQSGVEALSFLANADTPGTLRSPTDAAKEFGTAALQGAGAMLLPEIAAPLKAAPIIGRLAPGIAEGGAGVLKTLLSYLKGGAWGAGGDYVGTQAAQEIGIAPETTGEEDAERFVANTALGTLPYLADVKVRGANRLPYDPRLAAKDPQVQRAADFARRHTGAEPDGANLKSSVELANSRARDLDNSMAAELGANAGLNSEEIALGDRLRKSMPTARNLGVFDDAADPAALRGVVSEKEAAINASRAAKVEELGDSVLLTKDDLAPTLANLAGRVQKLRKTSATAEIADSIEATTRDFITDIASRPRINAADAVDMVQNLNEARRVLGQEFNATRQAAAIKGDSVNLAGLEASREALGDLQDGLIKALDAKVGDDFFSRLNTEQSALKTINRGAVKFERGIAEGRATRPASRLVKTVGQQGDAPTSFAGDVVERGPTVAALRKLSGWLRGEPEVSPGLQNALRVEESGTGAMENIRALMSLNENPASLPPAPGAPFGGRGPQGMIAGRDALTALGAAMGPTSAQAQQPPPVFPRDTNALLQNKDAFLATVQQISPDLVDDVQVALSQPNEARRDVMLSELAKGFPQLFSPSPYYSLWNNRINDVKERPLYADELRTRHKRGEFDANHWAAASSALNSDGTVMPAPPPVQPQGTPVLQGQANGQTARPYSY